MTDRTYDVVVYGATGFTGKLVAEYLLSARPTSPSKDDLRWAIAGRNEAKLDAVRKDLGAPELPILVADSQDGAALDAITSQTKVIITTVGPFYAYGQEVVASCVRNGTHYCDLTGETHFARAMDRKHHAAAIESGARIVNNAGYDSIPSDLGVWMMHEAMKEKGATLQRVDCYCRAKGGASGGTLDTMRQSIKLAGEDRDVRRSMADPYALYPEGEERGKDTRDVKGVSFADDADSYVAPFVMAGTNAPIVRRSNALLGFPYGRDFRYSETMTTGKGAGGWFRAWQTALGLGAFVMGMSMGPTRWVLDRVLPKPGEGPDKAAREAGWFKHLFVAKGVDPSGQEVVLRGMIGGDKDPGYGQTAVMIAEAGLCLAFDEPGEGTLAGGVLTPTSAMGTPLIERLRAAGMQLELV
ncbi:MAG: saccharopine dehydrogenase NADP-binding domain-containing protein [Deltaproteobacteria bacterium]|nr:saccharopine dehydrogenase NADP-binding domain-containing protein [Deltaproteobacteria bacterium]